MTITTQAMIDTMKSEITGKEIIQQPELWQEVVTTFKEKKEDIDAFIKKIIQNHDEEIQVIFTGAGTSAYVGDTITPYLHEQSKYENLNFQAIATTDLVSNPTQFFSKEKPTILVSCARSGNSPESLAAVVLGKELVKDFYQITVTCAKDGKLAQAVAGDDKNLLLLMPEGSNDQGFAMTGSFTCMTLANLLVFSEGAEAYVDEIIKLAHTVIENVEDIAKIIEIVPERIIYLGSGSLLGLAHEAQLKVLELTAGKIATMYESPLGFRHGPKSFVDEGTAIISFVSGNTYTKKYDIDLLNEVIGDEITKEVYVLTPEKIKGIAKEKQFVFDTQIPDAFLALPYILVAQFLAVMAALKIGNSPDNPSSNQTVNRVVKGVTIYPLDKQE